MNNPIEKWFGKDFSTLHPLIQHLHQQGGTLSGDVDISYGNGLAGFIGKRLAGKLGIPTHTTKNTLQVTINHTDHELLCPTTTAYKTITDDQYVFSVAFSLPILGNILSYSGRLVSG